MANDQAPAALYRRYRPGRFDALIGQEAPAAALTGALTGGRVSHAYLFSGPRGTGKTSTARILAKALNCTSPDGIEPCGTCPSCEAIATGTSLDVVELDAASNSGVDAVKNLIRSASLGAVGNRRVFIVDEVHMLTSQAAAALLKSIEEPPAHVIWVLATTDAHKLLATIKSRTQHLEFRLVAPAVLDAHLRSVAADAGLEATDTMIAAAVAKAGGSVRDALSALDGIVASGADTQAFSVEKLLVALESGEVPDVLKAVAEGTYAGVAARQLAEELIAGLRELFLVQMGAAHLVTTPEWPGRSDLAMRYGPKRTVAAMEAVGDAVIAMRDAWDSRVQLEVALARCCFKAAPTKAAPAA